MYFHSKTGDKGNFLQPFLQEKRRVLTAFKLLQGPSGNARLGDWLQRWGEKWDGPKGASRAGFLMIFGLNCVWCFVMLSLPLSLWFYDVLFCFGFHILRHPHGTKIETCVFVNLFQLSPTFARVGPKPAAGFTGPHESGPRDHNEMCNLFRIDVEWPSQLATSAAIPPLAYLIFIGTVTVLFVAMQLLHLIEFIPIFGGFYFIFLTNWTLLLETLTMVMLFASTLWGYLTPPGEGQKAPLFVRYTVSLWYIIQPMSLIVTILYWTLVNQFWDPYEIHFTSLWAHLLNWMVLIVALFLTRIPWRLSCT